LVEVGRTPQSLTRAGDLIWVAAFDDGLIRSLDGITGAFAGPPVKVKDSFPSDLTWAFDRLWVTDVVDDIVTDEHHEDEIPVGDSPVAITAGEGAVWTANFNDRTVSRIDDSGETGRPIIVGGKPSAIATGGGYVWVTRVEDDALIPIDAGGQIWTGDLLKVGDQPQAVVADGAVVWVANQGDGTIVRVAVEASED
jgi:DNA-binding beta-propeller fold protein YncE